MRKIAVVGLGYVGLPMAVEFGKKGHVIAFDVKEERISELKSGNDRTLEVGRDNLLSSNLLFTARSDDLRDADFYIVAVPTPINQAKQPDMQCVFSASRIVGGNLKKGDIVVYESTVYPGATEEECAPILEKCSGLVCGKDFFIGYSPERINPSDKEHSFTTICKVVSGQNDEILDIIANVYSSVVVAGVHRAPSIKVAEAAKVIENTQRDINIALINELAIMFEKLNINTSDVLKAAATKWNFLQFSPGLVGGHCIGVDPYYLTYKAHTIGLNPEVILAGRRVNDNMGKFIAEQTIKQVAKLGKPINGAQIAILGLTFKENCNDIRNTRVVDIISELKSYHANVVVHDPLACEKEVYDEYGLSLTRFEDIKNVDAIVLAVKHDFYVDLPMDVLLEKLSNPKLIIDVKSALDVKALLERNVTVWCL